MSLRIILEDPADLLDARAAILTAGFQDAIEGRAGLPWQSLQRLDDLSPRQAAYVAARMLHDLARLRGRGAARQALAILRRWPTVNPVPCGHEQPRGARIIKPGRKARKGARR